MSDIEFISGLSFKAPNEGAPDWLIAKGSIKPADLIAWLQSKEGDWVNFELKESKGGKLYAAVDNWKPNSGGEKPQREESRGGGGSSPPSGGDEPMPDDDIPFATRYGSF